VIVTENLNVSGIIRGGGAGKRGLNRAIGDAALGRIRGLLDYKTGWNGATLVPAGRWFPSTQLCSRCGAKTKLPLRERVYRCRAGCPDLDRDLNAAINLARLGDPPARVWKRGLAPAVGRPPTIGLEKDVEPTRRPTPPTR
jgi:putative transposase